MDMSIIANTVRLILAISLISTVFCDVPVIIETDSGPVRGYEDEVARNFLGIPFAAPPVGELRWADPEPPKKWNTPLDVNQFKPGCPQNCTLPPKTCPTEISEDCLYLNVYTPKSKYLNKLQPVMVYFHGGRFELSSAGNVLYNGKFMSNMSEVIIVTANYRIGALGWLAYGPFKGNYGIKDQRAALNWVRRNIRNFGGDPNMITVFGQSAGATSIASHMISDKSKGLFHRVILQSNPLQAPLKTLETYKPIAKALIKHLGCNDTDINCLRSKPFMDVVKSQKYAEEDSFDLSHPFLSLMAWTPVVSDDDIPMQPFDAFKKGQYTKLPILQGMMVDEGWLFIHLALKSNLSSWLYDLIIHELFNPVYPSVSKLYPPLLNDDNRPMLSDLGGDLIFYCPSINISDLFYQTDSNPIFFYLYNHSLSFTDAWGPKYPFCYEHPCHGCELPILFNTAESAGFNITKEERYLGYHMAAYWTNFARSGDPNIGKMSVPIKWKAYDDKMKNVLLFNTQSITLESRFREYYCNFWDEVGYNWGF